MKERNTTRQQRLSRTQVFKILAGAVVFGVLMEVRSELEQVWVRALVAACAAGVLSWALLQARKNKS